jgi:hypothetical protein
MRHDLPKRCPGQDSLLATRPRPERRGTRPAKIIGPQTATTSTVPTGSSGYIFGRSLESPQVIVPFQPTLRRNSGLGQSRLDGLPVDVGYERVGQPPTALCPLAVAGESDPSRIDNLRSQGVFARMRYWLSLFADMSARSYGPAPPRRFSTPRPE